MLIVKFQRSLFFFPGASMSVMAKCNKCYFAISLLKIRSFSFGRISFMGWFSQMKALLPAAGYSVINLVSRFGMAGT